MHSQVPRSKHVPTPARDLWRMRCLCACGRGCVWVGLTICYIFTPRRNVVQMSPAAVQQEGSDTSIDFHETKHHASLTHPALDPLGAPQGVRRSAAALALRLVRAFFCKSSGRHPPTLL